MYSSSSFQPVKGTIPPNGYVRFYLKSGVYKGCAKLNRSNYHNQFVGWINSGNVLKFGNAALTKQDDLCYLNQWI